MDFATTATPIFPKTISLGSSWKKPDKVMLKYCSRDGGPYSHFSPEPGEIKALVQETKEAFLSLGRVQYGPQNVERSFLQGRHAPYITTDMKAEDIFSHRNVRSVRTGYGLPPKYLEVVIGRKIKRDAVAGTALDWDIVS